jgi:hypothetical protein
VCTLAWDMRMQHHVAANDARVVHLHGCSRFEEYSAPSEVYCTAEHNLSRKERSSGCA